MIIIFLRNNTMLNIYIFQLPILLLNKHFPNNKISNTFLGTTYLPVVKLHKPFKMVTYLQSAPGLNKYTLSILKSFVLKAA